MKKHLYSLLILAMLGCNILLSGCEKEKEVNPAAPVSAKLDDGTAWNSKAVKGISAQGNITINATNVTGDVVIISVKAAQGTYTLSSSSTNFVSYKPLANNVPFVSNGCVSNPDGEIVVTEYDATAKVISGTFRAKMCGTGGIKTMTEGKFNKISF